MYQLYKMLMVKVKNMKESDSKIKDLFCFFNVI